MYVVQFVCLLTPDATGSKHVVICQWLSCISVHASRQMEGSKSMRRIEMNRKSSRIKLDREWIHDVSIEIFYCSGAFRMICSTGMHQSLKVDDMEFSACRLTPPSSSTPLQLRSSCWAMGSPVSLSPPNSDPTFLKCLLKVASLITRLFHALQNHESQNGSSPTDRYGPIASLQCWQFPHVQWSVQAKLPWRLRPWKWGSQP